MIAVTFALPAESSGLRKRLDDAKNVLRAGQKISVGRIGGHDVQVLHTGVGRDVARRRLIQYLDTFRPKVLISSGFAGAARINYRVGDLILAENFSDPAFLIMARRVLREQNAHTTKMFSVPRMVDAPEEREEVWRLHAAGAFDMETEVIAEVCALRGLRMLSLRVVSDTPRHPFPLPGEVLFDVARQKTPSFRLTKYLFMHPSTLPRLIRFAGQIARARRSLTAALVSVMRTEL